jgi:formate hydrogenlyase transcriptional activator
LLLAAKDFANYESGAVKLLQAEGVRSLCCVPLVTRDRALGAITVASFRDEAFTHQDLDLLTHVSNQVAVAVENALAFEEIASLKNKLAEEKLYLEDEIRTEQNFEEIIGESTALKNILKQVETVAPTDSTVLIQGETGTGKELIARAIHDISSRRGRTFVKINCAAIPTGLLESELFGHERGAFTGAIAPHFFWMKSAISRWSFSRNFFVCCRNRNLSAWAARAPRK